MGNTHAWARRAGITTARAVILVMILLVHPGCGAPPERDDRPPLIAATLHPLGSLAREIAGPDADVLVLLPPGASPHAFEPSPRMVADGSRAKLVVRVGAGLDDWARPIVREALDRGVPEIVAVEFVAHLLPATANRRDAHDTPDTHENHENNDAHDHTSDADDHDHTPDAHDHGPDDPHVWLDPPAMIPLIEEIARRLAEADPARAGAYAQRAAACADSLRALDAELREILAPVRGSAFVASHNAWAYFGRRYDLVQADVVQEVPTREPGPRRLAGIIRSSRDVRAVFAEVQVSDASARTLAAELRVPIAVLDPQGTSLDPSRDRYYDLMRWNARKMAVALGSPARSSSPRGAAGDATISSDAVGGSQPLGAESP